MLVANTSSELVGERTKDGDVLQIFFKGGGNILTKERLEAIKVTNSTQSSISSSA